MAGGMRRVEPPAKGRLPPALAGPVPGPVVGRKTGKPQGDSPGMRGRFPSRISKTCSNFLRLWGSIPKTSMTLIR